MPPIKNYCFHNDNYTNTTFESNWITIQDISLITLSILINSNITINVYFSMNNNFDIVKTETYNVSSNVFFTQDFQVNTKYLKFEITGITNPSSIDLQMFYHN